MSRTPGPAGEGGNTTVLIHSVTPAHMLTPAGELPANNFKRVGGCYLEGVDTPDGFRLNRIHSTDPAMYLRPELAPGSIYRA